MALSAALDNCLCLFFFARRDSITIADVPFVYVVVLVQCKKRTNFEVFPTYMVHMLFLDQASPPLKRKIYSYM